MHLYAFKFLIVIYRISSSLSKVYSIILFEEYIIEYLSSCNIKFYFPFDWSKIFNLKKPEII